MRKLILRKASSLLLLLLLFGAQQSIAQPTASVSGTTPADCNGTATGSISVSFSHTVNTLFEIKLDSAGSNLHTHTTTVASTSGTYTINGVNAFNGYSVIISELTGGTSDTINSINITEPAVLVLSANEYDVKCKNDANGAVKLKATGGTATGGYNFKKGTASYAPTDTFFNLGPGSYNFTVIDDNGCLLINQHLDLEDLFYDKSGWRYN